MPGELIKRKPKDIVRVVLSHPPHENLLVAEDIPLDIVYEDDEVMLNKPLIWLFILVMAITLNVSQWTYPSYWKSAI